MKKGVRRDVWSLAADYKVVALMPAGRMGEEVARAHRRGDESNARG